MAYKELIGHFARVRAYMQHFYVYGFHTRDEFLNGSARAYDDERRRVEGWLGEHVGFRQTNAGKSVFISFDSRSVRSNPLYRAWKAKSFTGRDVTLHFLLLDILADGVARTAPELLDMIHTDYLNRAVTDMAFDLSTVRGKLKEYEALGLLESESQGKYRRYRRLPDQDITALAPALAFFSEAAPCGVVGSFLEDRLGGTCDAFRQKHHYITATLDSGILCRLMDAISQERAVTLTRMGRRTDVTSTATAVPLYLLQSVQDGRCYLATWGQGGFRHCRIDRILGVELGESAANFGDLRSRYLEVRRRCWGTSLGRRGRTYHLEFTVRAEKWERHIPRRMLRECRCGRVESLPEGLTRFSAEVYDPMELLPWVRTFIGRITAFHCADEKVETRFHEDVQAMYALYAAEEL